MDHQRKILEDFWEWFVFHSEELKRLHSNREFQRLTAMFNSEIDKVNKQLAWEIGPGIVKAYLLTISSEGNTFLRPISEEMVRMAPDLPDWEFYAAKPQRPAARAVVLPGSATKFQTNSWRFFPEERSDEGRIDLTIVDEQLAIADPKVSLKAVSIYLDELLGEDTVENWIGDLKIASPDSTRNAKLHDASEIPDYLHWATHRDKNPLGKK